MLTNYTGPVIFKKWWSTDAYKESCNQKAMKMAFFEQALKLLKNTAIKFFSVNLTQESTSIVQTIRGNFFLQKGCNY